MSRYRRFFQLSAPVGRSYSRVRASRAIVGAGASRGCSMPVYKWPKPATVRIEPGAALIDELGYGVQQAKRLLAEGVLVSAVGPDLSAEPGA